MFRGNPYRSAFVRGIIEHCTKDEIRHLLSIHKEVHDTITKEEQQAELHRTQQQLQFIQSHSHINTTEHISNREETDITPSWIPHIYIQAERHPIQEATMVDSGANHNIININTLRQIQQGTVNLTPTRIVFKVGDTHEVPVLGKFKLTFQIQNQTFIESFFVMQQTNFSILLGNAFLHKYRCNIDYDTHTLAIKLNNSKITRTHIFPKDAPHKQPSFPLTTIEETLVKKDGVTSIETQLSNKHYQSLPDHQFAIITKEISLLHTHQCIVSEGFHFLPSRDNGRIIVHILNTSGRDLHIPAHTHISQFIPCKVEDLTDGGYAMEVDMKDLLTTTAPSIPTVSSSTLQNIQVSTSTHTEGANIHRQLLHNTNIPIPSVRGFKDIKSIFDINDFTPEELELKFKEAGIQDILPSLDENLINMPGGLTPDRLLALKQFIAKRQTCWSVDENPRHVRNYSVTIKSSNI